MSRTLAVIVIATPFLALMGGLGYWGALHWREQGERIADERALSHEYDAKTTQARLYDPVMDMWRSYAATEASGLSLGNSLEISDQAFRAMIAETFRSFGGKWIGAERLPLRKDGRLTSVRLEARGRVPEENLAPLLEAIETHSPFIFIDALDARRIQTDRDAPTQLELRLRVSGYRLSEDHG